MSALPRLFVLTPLGWGHSNASPFSEKALGYLRLAGIPAKVETTLSAQGGPKGKLPWLELGSRRIPDSQSIVDWVVEERDDPLGEARLDAPRRKLNHLVRRTVEESLYFAMVVERWSDPAVWEAYASALLGALPPVVGRALLPVARRGVLKQMHAQGYGRHDMGQLARMVGDDLDGIVEVLGDRPFLGGEGPVAADLALFAWLSGVIDVPVRTGLGEEARRREALLGHLERTRDAIEATTPLQRVHA